MGSNTPNLGFYKPDDGEDGWGDEKRADWDDLDSRVQNLSSDGTTADLESVNAGRVISSDAKSTVHLYVDGGGTAHAVGRDGVIATGTDLFDAFNNARDSVGINRILFVFPDGDYNASTTLNLTNSNSCEVDFRGCRVKYAGDSVQVDGTGTSGLRWWGGELGGGGANPPSENILLANSSSTLSQQNRFYGVKITEASNSNVALIGSEENLFSGCDFRNTQGRWVVNSDTPKYSESSSNATMTEWTTTLNRFVNACSFGGSGLSQGIQLWGTSDIFTIRDAFFNDPGTHLIELETSDGNITQPVIEACRCDADPPVAVKAVNSSASTKQVEDLKFGGGKWTISSSVIETASDVQLIRPCIRIGNDSNGNGSTFNGPVTNGKIDLRGTTATFGDTVSGFIYADSEGDATINGFVSATILSSEPQLKVIRGGSSIKVTDTSVEYDPSNLSGTAGSVAGETRMDDGTNTSHGDPDICIWNGSAWRQSGTTTTFT